MTVQEFAVSSDRERLDLFLASAMPDFTRSQLKRLVDEGNVLVNGIIAKAARRLHTGDQVRVSVPPPRVADLTPESIPLDVVYQDPEILVLDKPPGIVVHPSPGHPSRTLVNALLALCPDLKGIGGELRPGIVHRLDKDTSGLMVVAKTATAHVELSRQLKEGAMSKVYLALAKGHIRPGQGSIDAPIGRDPRNRKRMAVLQEGRASTTDYRVLRRIDTPSGTYSLLEAFPRTGRTHQIRVHLSYIGHPLAGDATYGNRGLPPHRQFLHAHKLGFHHPARGAWQEFTSPLPADLNVVLRSIDDAAQDGRPVSPSIVVASQPRV